MSRVLITGGTSPIGTALAKRLLADPAYDVRISDRRPAPRWMREGCEIHDGELRVPSQASAAAKGCSHVVHLARFAPVPGEALAGGAPHSLLEYEAAQLSAIVRATLERRLERFLYISSGLVFERPQLFPTPEEHLPQCPPPRSARGLAQLIGERFCAAAGQQHGLQYTIFRPFDAYSPHCSVEDQPDPVDDRDPVDELVGRALAARRPLELYGSGEQTVTPTHADDIAQAILAALGSPAAVNEDFNLGTERELTMNEVARIAWEASGAPAEELELARLPARAVDVERSCPAVQKARELLGWEAQIEFEQGVLSGRGIGVAL